MEVTYLCPHCRGAINADNNIILSAKSSKNKIGLVLLHEDIGNYTVVLSPSLTVETGEIVDFFCPICHKSLNIKKGDSLARYIRLENGVEESFIIISRAYGERITFKVDKNKHIDTYGESLSRYIDPDWFL
jgi:Zn finger protein HypA/HybF involved in hydrogenase expression